MDSTFLREYRCDCGRLLFKGVVVTSHIEIKCSRCGKINAISGIADGFSSERFYTLFLDNRGRVLNTSESARDILGYSKKEITQKYISEIISIPGSDFFEKVDLAFSTDSSADHSVKYDARQKKNNGEEAPLEVWVRIFMLGDRKYYICICADSTELAPDMKVLRDSHIIPKVWAATASIVMEVLAVIGNHVDF